MVTTVLFDVHRGRRDPRQPQIHADDLAVVRGDGIFETLLVRDGRACNLQRHLDRFATGAARMDLPAPDVAAWRTAVEGAVAAWAQDNENADGLMRLVYSRGRESAPAGPRSPDAATALVMITAVGANAAHARERGVRVCLLDRGYPVDFAGRAPWQLIGVKTLSYAANMAALRYAAAHGFDDVVYLSSDGAVLEGPRSTVVAVRDRELRTPPVESGILPGTTVAAIFALARARGWVCRTEPLTPDDLLAADSVWLCSSVTIAARVTRIDDTDLALDADAARGAAEFAELAQRAVVTA